MTKPNGKIGVLLISEGTYPYYPGGISTWSHLLCERVTNANFTLYSMNAGYEEKPIFHLSDNVKEVIQVPLWAPDEPQDYISFKRDYYKVVNRKEHTTDEVVKEKFVPIFSRFMQSIVDPPRIQLVDKIFHDLWEYFQDYDYKQTMKSQPVWECFRDFSRQVAAEHQIEASLFDLTVGLRWLYRFFIPMSIPIPRADISHITLSGFPLIPALVLKYQYGTPMIITEHGVYVRERLLYINRSDYSYFIKFFLIKLTELVTKLSYHKADRILSVNEFNKSWEVMYGADPNKIQVTYNGVDTERFQPRPKPEHQKSIPRVVAAARIFELKDILTMIKTCDVVKTQLPEVQFLVYGDKNAVPEYTAQCEALIEELNLTNNFFLKGHHPQPELIYSEGDISILTSISEGFPFTVLESMSSGVPVVGTDVGGVKEAIDSESGFVCKPRDPQQIGEKVIELLTNESLREQMAKHARKRVIEHFSLELFIQSYEEVYQKVYEKSLVEVAI